MTKVPDKIYQMVMDSLHITYSPDESTVRRLKNEIASGIAYIKKYCNPDAECRPGTRFGELLCEYVLRAEAGASETFSRDFAEEITATEIAHETKKYAEAMGYAQV